MSRLTNLFILLSLTALYPVLGLAQQATTTSTESITTVTGEKHIIVTEVPAPKVKVTIPENYLNCFTVDAGWHKDVWVPAHQVCQYANSPEGIAWVEGYWACTKYKTDTGECTNWDWTDAHWVKVLNVY